MSGLIAAAIIGFVVLFFGWQAWRRKRFMLLVPALVALAVPGLFLWHMLSEEAKYDFNPMVASSELVGTWRHGTDSVTLTADGAYRATSWPAGTWNFASDFEVQIGDHRLRVLRGPDGLVLCSSCLGDPDDWEWNKVLWVRAK